MARVNRKAHSINFPKILSAVPVGLMPLLPETPAPSPIHSPPMSPSNSTTMNMVRPPSPPATPPRPAPSSIPAPNPPRMKTFAFLPLLDTPPDSKPSPPQPPASCPPTTKLPARTTMQMVPPSPPSEAESSAKAPSVSYFPPQPKANGSNLAPPQASSSSSVVQQHNITLHNPNVRKVRLQPLRSPALNPPSPFSLYPPSPRDSSDSDSEMEHYHSSTSSNANTKEFVLDLADLRSRREAMRLRQEREEARTWEPCNTLHFGPMDGL
ncbi:hypothetical protein BD410DRAFT_787112 [Rickenella mellea]|uniref:Uncharacterized protein n=1 Tax=Rickenella mellea TaxID=50990 RepID=A0A4Y7Q838_9AGAM|nr:hypothetical protein BD410DRAFT_787112 [Rickenella mellea]